MVDKDSQKMIINFIQKTYPVTRIKRDGRFRRAIVLDEGECIFKDRPTTTLIKVKLARKIVQIFACSENEAQIFITRALNI